MTRNVENAYKRTATVLNTVFMCIHTHTHLYNGMCTVRLSNDIPSDFKLMLCTEMDEEELNTASVQEIKWSDN